MNEEFLKRLKFIHLINVYSNFLETKIPPIKALGSFIYLITLVVTKNNRNNL